jgi:DNA modification methylase
MPVRKATLICGDALAVLRAMPARSIHCGVTSPPYWGLRDYGVAGQLGLERSPAEYLAFMVAVFEEFRRVLRDDGVLFLNMGDTYYSTGGHADTACNDRRGSYNIGNRPEHDRRDFRSRPSGSLKPKDLTGMPWRLAFALQDAGWWLRRDIIWAKPNPMPEGVTDRPTTAHEYVFLLAKSERYFYDAEAVREPAIYAEPNAPDSIASPYGQGFTRRANPGNRKAFRGGGAYTAGNSFDNSATKENAVGGNDGIPNLSRNLRSVWTIPTSPFPEAHFATFPPELARRCIAAGTSERGCCSECGAPWKREVSIDYENPGNRSTNGPRSEERKHQEHGSAGYAQRLERRASTSGWTPTCGHVAEIAPSGSS